MVLRLGHTHSIVLYIGYICSGGDVVECFLALKCAF